MRLLEILRECVDNADGKFYGCVGYHSDTTDWGKELKQALKDGLVTAEGAIVVITDAGRANLAVQEAPAHW